MDNVKQTEIEKATAILTHYAHCLDIRDKGQVSGETVEEYAKLSLREIIDAMELILAQHAEDQKHIKSLSNRCHALTGGQLCLFCPIEECENRNASFRGHVDG